MNKIRLSQLVYFGLLFMLTACQAAGQPLSAAMFRPGDTINGVTLATGAESALPLWGFCSPSQENTPIRTFNCRASELQTLAIGHVFLLAEEVSADLDGSDLVWNLSIDNQIVDLESFGKFEYMMPSMAKSPSPIREVFKKATAWNIVMTNLSPGEHSLSFRAQSATDSHSWLVNLVIEAADGADLSSGHNSEKILTPRHRLLM
jgi:hypothetical protein